MPELVSWEWGKADRDGRARLDYTQNAMIKTLVAPYAVRPVPSAPFPRRSPGMNWTTRPSSPTAGTCAPIIERVTSEGDLFKGVLERATGPAATLLRARTGAARRGGARSRRVIVRAKHEGACDDQEDGPQVERTRPRRCG